MEKYLSDLGIAFLEGLLSALSACVYPLIPITTALFVGGESRSWLRGLLMSGIYVSGLSLTYVTLGVIAALTGQVFGSYLGNPWVLAGFSLFFFIMALSFLEVIPLRFTAMSSIQVKPREGILYPLALGIFSGFIAAPCTAPLFGAVLLDIAAKASEHQSVLPGVSKALAFSLGIGFPFLWIGVFALKLPKPGPWLKAVKYFGATILFTAGLHYLDDITGSIADPHQKGTLVIAGIFLFVLFFVLAEPLKEDDVSDLKVFKKSKRHAAVLLFVASFGVYLATVPFAGSIGAVSAKEEKPVLLDKNGLKWYTKLDLAFQNASSDQPILVDLWADWCEACHEMEEKLFSLPEFRQMVKTKKIVLARLNFTDESEANMRIAQKYGIRGLPTLLVLDKKGNLRHKIIGFVNTTRSMYSISQGILKFKNALKKESK